MGGRDDDALETMREAALDALDENLEEALAEEAAPTKKVKVVDAAIAALFPADTVELGAKLLGWSKLWREATQREAPSIERLATEGKVERIDADWLSGYVAVVTADDTWRAFLPREDVPAVVGLILRRSVEEVAKAMAEGPGSLAPRGS